jgi:hypothetical protein
MKSIADILQQKVKPKEKQTLLVEAIVSGEITAGDFIEFFEYASDVDKGTCADVMKNVSAIDPGIFIPYIDNLIKYINYKAPRVKWGIPETIGNMAKDYPNKTIKAIPHLLENVTENKVNTTVIKWCAAFALTEIARHNPQSRKQLIPVFEKLIEEEKNNGVKNVYNKAIKAIKK